MANEHSIRVSAKGEFGQLNRGLKQLQGDLKGVLGEIDKGARKGGIFDDTSLRALDLYRNRFKDSMEELNREFEKQNNVVDRLHEKMKNGSRSEQEDLRKQIALREKEMDTIRKQLFEVEKLHSRRNQEASTYGSPAGGGAGGSPSSGGGMGGAGMLGGGMLAKLLGGGKLIAGLAGLAGIGAMANQAYQGAYQSRTMPMDLAQRIRGQEGWQGDSYNMWNRSYDIGTRDKMGYGAAESWQFQDMFSRQAGTLGDGDMEHLLKFGRAYGLNTSEVASGVGGMREIGGTVAPAQFADLIAGSVEKSGMQPRILEVMETSAGLLTQMNTTLKDTGAKQILAYQTTLDTIGMDKGMMSLTGKQGANIISGLGGIYDPQNEQWKMMGMQALQRHDPEKYGNMGLYGLESSFEDGLLNDDNLPAMVDYLREKSGGDENLLKRMMQKWLQGGGYNATKTQVDDLYGATDGMTAFSEENMKKVREQLGQGDATAPYEERVTEIGQRILDVNSRFDKQLEELGQPLLEIVTGIKEGITDGLEWFNNNDGIQATLEAILDFLGENWKTLASIAAIALLGGTILKGLGIVGSLLTGLGALTGKGFGLLGGTMLKNLGVLGLIAGGVLGAKWLSNQFKEQQEKKIQNTKDHYAEGFGLSEDELDQKMKEFDVGFAQLGVGVADPKVAAMVESLNTERQKKTGIIDKNGKRRTSEEWSTWANEEGKVFTKQEKDDLMNYMSGLEDKGDLNLTELNESGQFNFESMLTMSTDTFTDLFDMSDKNFGALMKDGTESFDKLYKEGSNYLGGVFEEHKGFKDFFGKLWSDFSNQMAGLMGGGGSYGGGSVGGGYDVRNMSGVTASQLNAKMGGKLSGTGQSFIDAGNKYGIDPAFLASVAMHETGNGSSNAINSKNNVGGMMKGGKTLMSFDSVGSGIEAMASNLKRLYLDQGLYTVEDIQKKYAPNGAANDPTGLNSHWVGGVSNFLSGFGVDGGSGSPGRGNNPSGKSVFTNWKKNVTSRFNSMDSVRNGRAHTGLDIDGEQGDHLEAIVGGVVSKVFHDKENTTAGGNTVMVKMADGMSYAYAHLSQINPNLKEGMQVGAGDWIGNMGGDKGKPGSGYSTTGSHLHLGYYDKNGKAIDPEQLMNRIGGGMRGGMGDLDINQLENSGANSPYSLDFTNRSLGDVMRNALGIAPEGSGGGKGATQTLNVNLKLDGEGARVLNNATHSQLEALIKKIMAQTDAQRMAMNPTTGGWG